jgi:Tfp pilus assembly protein PilO
VAIWFLVLNPVRGDIAATKTSIEDQQLQLASAQLQLDQAEATREEGRRNQVRLLELAKMVPSSQELPSLLLQIQDLADLSGIAFIAVTPGDLITPDTGNFVILPLDLQFVGTYFNVSDFAYRAEQMAAGPGRLLAIKSLSLDLGGQVLSSSDVSPLLAVSMTLYAFLQEGTSASSAPSSSGGTGSSGSTATSTSTTEPVKQ